MDFKTALSIIIPFIVGIAPAFITIINVKSVNKAQKELSDESLKLQREISEKRITADIILKSRVTWIQDVRKITANIFSLYSQYTYSTDSEKNSIYSKFNSEVLKLRLYFSTLEEHEMCFNFKEIKEQKNPKAYVVSLQNGQSKSDNAQAVQFLKRSDNKGKNKYMVELLTELSNVGNKDNDNINYMSALFIILVEATSNYLKIEWEVIKGNN